MALTDIPDEGLTLAQIRKNGSEQLLLRVVRYQGHDLIDLRVNREVGGELQRTRKGLCLSAEVWREVLPPLVTVIVEQLARGREDHSYDA